MFNLLNKHGIAFWASLAWLTAAAIVMPTFAMLANYEAHKITLVADAEDDCPYYYGAYALDDVTSIVNVSLHGADHDHRVLCVYR